MSNVTSSSFTEFSVRVIPVAVARSSDAIRYVLPGLWTVASPGYTVRGTKLVSALYMTVA